MSSKNGPSEQLSALPRHVAVIMDGNGRWAKRRFMPRIEGHRNGAKSVRMIVEESRKLGIRYLTLYAFSTENWNRPRDEVSGLMKIFEQFLESELSTLADNGVRLRAMGDHSKLPDRIRSLVKRNEERTAHLQELDLILAVSYGAREEIVSAARRIAFAARDGALNPESINDDFFRSMMYLPDVPDPDLLIRTSDEFRISNFLLWQLAYSEIVVSPVMWPDFDRAEYIRCLREFAGRSRRFGLTEEQLNGSCSEQSSEDR